MISDRMDRYVRGDLSPAEARDLAQASLESPELFAELTDSALAKASLYSAPLPTPKIVSFPRTAWFVTAGVAAAAAVVLLSLAVVKPRRTATPNLTPVLALGISNSQPILLAGGLQPTPTDPHGAPVFRGPHTGSRAPRIEGAIVSIDEGLATIDLGSLDGLAKDSELPILRADQPTQPIGRLQVTTVFRERARGRILDGQKPRVNDRVRVDAPTHLAARIQHVDALHNRGDADAAYQAADQASQWLEAASKNDTATVPASTQSELWNRLAVLRILRGDYLSAEAPLTRAAALSTGKNIASARSSNNLGVLSELRGDRRDAQSQYTAALQALTGLPDAPEQERRAVQANLARLRGSQ
jgi:hypothetical protein